LASVDDVLASIGAVADRVEEIVNAIAGSKAQAEEVVGALQALEVEGTSAAVNAAKDQLEENSVMALALSQKLSEVRTVVESAKAV
jgi:hypothetical protein